MSVRRNIQMIKMLSYFERVVDYGQLKRAAEELGLRQSNLSREMKDLEILVGQPLLVRKGRGLAVTATGEKIYFRARECSQIISEVSDYIRQNTANDCLNICIPPSFMNKFSHIFTDFKKHHPHISCKLQTSKIGNSVHLNDIDIGVVYGRAGWPDINIICEGRMVFAPVATQKYIDKYGHPKDKDELNLRHRVCLCDEFGRLNEWGNSRSIPFNCAEYEVSGIEMMISLLHRECLVSAVPLYLLNEYPDLIPIAAENLRFTVPVQLITARGRYKISHVHYMCGQIIKLFENISAGKGMENLVIYPFYTQYGSVKKAEKS